MDIENHLIHGYLKETAGSLFQALSSWGEKRENPGLSPSAGCRLNSPAEKEVITSWILVSNHSVKNNERFFRLRTYNHLISEPYRTV